MTQDDAGRSPYGRSALGGASAGLTYDGVMLDAVAREDRLRRPLRLRRWQDGNRPRPTVEARREQTVPESANPSH